MWRLLYSKKKLQASERQALQQALDDVMYTCGAQLQDLELPESLAEVYARDIRCHDPTEKLYYSVGTYPPICVYCASEESLITKDSCYPQCQECSSREQIKKRN